MGSFDYIAEGQMTILDFLNRETPMLKFSSDTKVHLIECFGGIGSQAMSLERLGIDFTSTLIEFDKYPVASYNAIHGTDFKPTDITKIHAEDLEIDKDRLNILCYSFPCFTEDMLVMTTEGLIKIKDVKKGQLVMTHDNTFRNVLDSGKTGTKEIWKVKGMCFDEVDCTENHLFYTREMVRHYPTVNGKRLRTREFLEPIWKECKDLTKKDYLGISINKNSVLPEWNGIYFEWKDGRKGRHKNHISTIIDNHSFWWIIGRYLGDGWLRNQGGIIICCDKNETNEILTHLRNCDLHCSISEERTVNKLHISSKEIGEFLYQFGRGAENKKLPGFVFDIPSDYARSLVEGYLSADGCFSKGEYKVASVSKELIYGMAQIVAKAYKRPYRIYKCNVKPFCFIEGRKCKQRTTYQLVFSTKNKKQDKAFYEDGYVWFPINSVEKTDRVEDVYDLTVEDNHSFTVNGCIVHNCQDISVAGLGKSLEKGSGTRSGLLWEVERLLDECGDNKPEILLMENVKNLLSKKHKDHFDKWCEYLESKGYSNFHQVMNAKNYGVAQNRERVFMVSCLGDYKYDFPKEIPLEKRMKDYLEDEVEDKYYITSEKAKTLIDKLILEGKILNERTNERTNERIGNLQPETKHQSQNVYSENSKVAPNIMAGTHGYGMGYIEQCEKISKQ